MCPTQQNNTLFIFTTQYIAFSYVLIPILYLYQTSGVQTCINNHKPIHAANPPHGEPIRTDVGATSYRSIRQPDQERSRPNQAALMVHIWGLGNLPHHGS